MSPRCVRSALFAAGCAVTLIGAAAMGQSSGELFPGVSGHRPLTHPTPPKTAPATTTTAPAPVVITPPPVIPPEPVRSPAPVVVAPPAKPKKFAVPSDADIAKADKLVMEVLGDDIAKAKTPEQKIAIAKKLLGYASDERNPATRYVMLVKTKTLAVESSDLDLAIDVIDDLDGAFEIDALKLAADSLTNASKTYTIPVQRMAGYAMGKKLIERSVDAGRFDVAKPLGELCVILARGTGEANLLKEATAIAIAIKDAEQTQVEMKDALAAIAAKPDDAAAHLKVGLFLCYTKGDWQAGLKNLSQGSDKTLAELAKLDLSSPSSSADQLKIADGWWDASQALSDLPRKRVQAHAAGYYASAAKELTGLHKAKAEKRIAEAAGK